MDQNSIEVNLKSIKTVIKNRATLVAVSKYVSASEIKMAYDLGQRDFGRTECRTLKAKSLKDDCPDIKLHMISLNQIKLKNFFNA